jgi:SAM-dependent methyltransferase
MDNLDIKQEEINWKRVSYEAKIGYGRRHLDNTYHSEIVQPFLENLRTRQLPPRVIDVACGQGEVARILENQGFGVWRLDISREVLNTQGGNRVNALATNLPFKREYFGGLHMKDALVHIKYKKELLRSMWSVLVPGGVAVITTIPKVSKDKVDNGIPYYKLNTDRFCKMAKKAGFKVLEEDKLWRPGTPGGDWYAIPVNRRVIVLEKRGEEPNLWQRLTSVLKKKSMLENEHRG